MKTNGPVKALRLFVRCTPIAEKNNKQSRSMQGTHTCKGKTEGTQRISRGSAEEKERKRRGQAKDTERKSRGKTEETQRNVDASKCVAVIKFAPLMLQRV